MKENSKYEFQTLKNIQYSLESTTKYKDLSRIYNIIIEKYNYYEFFTTQVFCQHIEELESIDYSVVLAAADSLVERKIIKKIITPFINQKLIAKKVSDTSSGGNSKNTKKILKSNNYFES